MNGGRSLLVSAAMATLIAGAAMDTSRAADAASAERRFSLLDQHGKAVSDTDFRGRWLIVFFGFTRCPDVCPATLAVMASALRTLRADANELQPIFITTDPLHDTPQALASFLRNFGPDFIGLTGTSAQIAAAAESFGVYRARSTEGGDEVSSPAHSSTLYLLDPQGRLNRQFSAQITAEQLVAYLRKSVRSVRHAESQS
jgi:protein SCO1/2